MVEDFVGTLLVFGRGSISWPIGKTVLTKLLSELLSRALKNPWRCRWGSPFAK
jgi:hypothetical protein